MSQNENKKKQSETEVVAKAKRRQFTAGYKLKIIQEYEACKSGEKGALLRREGLYSSHITSWRREQEAGLQNKKRGPKVDLQAVENVRLQKENESLRKKLKQAELVIEVQKKSRNCWRRWIGKARKADGNPERSCAGSRCENSLPGNEPAAQHLLRSQKASQTGSGQETAGLDSCTECAGEEKSAGTTQQCPFC